MEDGYDKQRMYVGCVWHSLLLFLSIKQSVVYISTHRNYEGGGSSNLIFDYALMRFRRINGWGDRAKGKSVAKERDQRLRLKWSPVQSVQVTLAPPSCFHKDSNLKLVFWLKHFKWSFQTCSQFYVFCLQRKNLEWKWKSMQPKIDIPFRLLACSFKALLLHVWARDRQLVACWQSSVPGLIPCHTPHLQLHCSSELWMEMFLL